MLMIPSKSQGKRCASTNADDRQSSLPRNRNVWVPCRNSIFGDGFSDQCSDVGSAIADGLWLITTCRHKSTSAIRATHVAALVGKAITKYYYGKAPKHSYFWGGSTGGRQALVEAQRFPWDFDGIISIAPWINDTDSAMVYVWANRALGGMDGKPIVSRAILN